MFDPVHPLAPAAPPPPGAFDLATLPPRPQADDPSPAVSVWQALVSAGLIGAVLHADGRRERPVDARGAPFRARPHQQEGRA